MNNKLELIFKVETLKINKKVFFINTSENPVFLALSQKILNQFLKNK